MPVSSSRRAWHQLKAGHLPSAVEIAQRQWQKTPGIRHDFSPPSGRRCRLITYLICIGLVLSLLVPQGLFGLVAVNNNHTCNQWQYSGEIPGESWCQLHMPLNGSIRILDLGGAGPHCPIFLDVRFANGAVSIGNRLDFSRTDSWTANLTSDYPSVYFLIRKQSNCARQERTRVVTDLSFHQLEPVQTDHSIGVGSERVARLGQIGDQVQDLKLNQITVITQLDSNRLPRLEQLVQSSTLPVVAAVYCDGTAAGVQAVKEYFANSPLLQKRALIELVGPGVETRHHQDSWISNWYPIQALRNIALESALTNWVIYVEADMQFGGGDIQQALHHELRSLSRFPGQVASILPVYELPDENNPAPKKLPEKGHVRNAGLVPCSYGSHQFTNYSRWEGAGAADPAQLMNNDDAWFDTAPRDSECVLFNHGLSPCSPEEIDIGWAIEPYFLTDRRKAPGYDPVVEFGMWDKLSQIKAMAMLEWRWALNAEVYLYNAPNTASGLLQIQKMELAPSYQQHTDALAKLSPKETQAAESKAKYYQSLHLSCWLRSISRNMTWYAKPSSSTWWKEWSPLRG